MLLPLHPPTDLIAPSPDATAARPGSSTLTPLVLRAAAGHLGLTPAQLRTQIASGKTLRQIARSAAWIRRDSGGRLDASALVMAQLRWMQDSAGRPRL